MNGTKQQFVVTLWVRDGDYPYVNEHGVTIDDPQWAICARLGNGGIPTDGVTVDPLGVQREIDRMREGS